MSDLRATLWVRWPDEDEGPLWAAVHVNRRAGEARVVGFELWTEPPGDARSDLGPAASPADDLAPWPASALRAADLRAVSLPALADPLLLKLPPDGPDQRLGRPERRRNGGRPPRYGADHWRAVAAVWGRAEADARTRAVADSFCVSRTTAQHWVQRCRQLGMLEG